MATLSLSLSLACTQPGAGRMLPTPRRARRRTGYLVGNEEAR